MRYQDFNDQHDWQQILELWENFDDIVDPDTKTRQIKQQAAEYLDIDVDISKRLSHHELGLLLAKADKMKTSTKKEIRARGHRLAKQVQWAFNLHK
jgi:hypothetical protein